MNALRRTLVGGAMACLALATACQVLIGIGEDHFTVVAPDVSTPQPEAGATVDRCLHAFPPSPPDAASTVDPDDVSMVLGLKTLDVSGADDAGVPVGFDIDGVCTCDPRDQSPRAGGTSCNPPGPKPLDPSGCDADGGIDNSAVKLFSIVTRLPQYQQFSVATTRQLECGRLNLLLFISAYNGQADDPRVDVGVVESFGIRDPHDAGDPENVRCGFDGDGGKPLGPFPARFDGTDRWSVRTNAVLRGGDSIPRVARGTTTGYVSNYVFVFDGRLQADVSIPILFGADLMQIRSPVLVGRLEPRDASGAPIPIGADGRPSSKPVTWALRDALFAGRARADDMLSRIGAIRIGDLNGPDEQSYFCSPLNALLYGTFKTNLCAAADLRLDPRDDFRGLECDALSFNLRLDAVPVQIGRDYDPIQPPPGCGAGWVDSCSQ